MIERALASKGLVAYVLACATGITLYFRWPFPEDDLVLHLISIRAPLIYAGFKYTYTLFLFTTPYIAYSLVLSGRIARSNRCPYLPTLNQRGATSSSLCWEKYMTRGSPLPPSILIG